MERDHMHIAQAIEETLDAIGDDGEYATARAELLAAADLLTTGTTTEAAKHLDRALALLDSACPI
jgi:hypothetical protein